MAGQELRDDEMADVLVGPVGQMTGDAGKEGDIERLPHNNISIVKSIPRKKGNSRLPEYYNPPSHSNSAPESSPPPS